MTCSETDCPVFSPGAAVPPPSSRLASHRVEMLPSCPPAVPNEDSTWPEAFVLSPTIASRPQKLPWQLKTAVPSPRCLFAG